MLAASLRFSVQTQQTSARCRYSLYDVMLILISGLIAAFLQIIPKNHSLALFLPAPLQGRKLLVAISMILVRVKDHHRKPVSMSGERHAAKSLQNASSGKLARSGQVVESPGSIPNR